MHEVYPIATAGSAARLVVHKPIELSAKVAASVCPVGHRGFLCQLFEVRSHSMELKNVVGDGSYADTVLALVSAYLDNLEHRTNREKLGEY